MKKRFIVKVTDQPGQLGKIGIILGQYGINIENIKFEREENSLTITFLVVIPQNANLEEVFNALSKENWVLEVNLE